MQQIKKSLVHSCGHVSHYKMSPAKNGVDLESNINGVCPVCIREDAEFKAQVAHVFSKLFGGFNA